MKKLGLLLMPLMAISLLASCSKPTPSPVTTYTLTFNCIDCKAYDESKNEITSVEIIPSPSYTTYAKFYLEGKEGRKPLKSLVNVKKTNANEDVDYEYNTITGELFIPVIDNLTITAIGTIKTLEECSWPEINEISTSGLADKYFALGEEKKVQLKHQSGNIYQTVRIIGFNQDYTELPKGGGNPDPNKVIGITFEFVNPICDDQGYSIATQWDDTDAEKDSNNNFLDSSVRKALTKNGNGHILWTKKGATSWSNEPGGLYTDRSVLEMLPDELTKEGILKTPAKYINIWNDNKQPEAGWEEQVVNDKLFLLSPAEMGRIGHEQEEPHTVTYSLYEGHSKYAEEIRIKKQIKGAEIYESIPEIPSAQTYKGIVYNFAGYNCKADKTGGGEAWLRSPFLDTGEHIDNLSAWLIFTEGQFATDRCVNESALAVAPAFCI